MRKSLLSLGLLASLVVAAPAMAQEAEAAEPLEFAGSVTATSDYLWRGVSQTQHRPALQLDLNLTHAASGLYAGVWASNVDFTASGEEDDGIGLELDPYIGWSGNLGERANLDVFVTRVTYPGHKADFDYSYTELEGRLTFDERFYVGAAYSPDIFNLGGKGLYTYGGIETPLADTGFGVKAQLGHYDLSDPLGDSYHDYLLGLTRQLGPVRAELQYTGTGSYGEAISEGLDDRRMAKPRLALNLVWEF